MGIYTEDVIQKTTSESSNTGATTNVIGKVATTLASIGAIGLGHGITKGAIASNSATKATVGQLTQKLGFQFIGRNVGGFSGIVIGSNIADAFQTQTYKDNIDSMLQEKSFLKDIEIKSKAMNKLPSDMLKENIQAYTEELQRREGGGNGR